MSFYENWDFIPNRGGMDRHSYKYLNFLHYGVSFPCPAVLPGSATGCCTNVKMILHVSQNLSLFSLDVQSLWAFLFSFPEMSGSHRTHRQWGISLLCHINFYLYLVINYTGDAISHSLFQPWHILLLRWDDNKSQHGSAFSSFSLQIPKANF